MRGKSRCVHLFTTRFKWNYINQPIIPIHLMKVLSIFQWYRTYHTNCNRAGICFMQWHIQEIAAELSTLDQQDFPVKTWTLIWRCFCSYCGCHLFILVLSLCLHHILHFQDCLIQKHFLLYPLQSKGKNLDGRPSRSDHMYSKYLHGISYLFFCSILQQAVISNKEWRLHP